MTDGATPDDGAAALTPAAPEEIGLSSDRLARLGRVLREEAARGRVPGGVALVARGGRLGYLDAFGRRDPASDAPMTADAIFRIYSMTKPIASVAAMMLWEEGRFLLSDPIGKYLPALADLTVGVLEGGEFKRVPPARPVTIQDLLRHTSGLTYEFRGSGPVHKMYGAAKLQRRSQTNAEHVETLGKMPLLHQPGTRWEYGRSTDVIGRLIEVLSGERLGEHLERRILAPLGMTDTGFHVPPAQHGRIAESFGRDPDSGGAVQLLDVRTPPAFESAGGGLAGTIGDYARFLEMLLDGGVAGGTRYLSRKTVELMTADHLGEVTGAPDLLLPGHGFGLGFSIRLRAGVAHVPGSVGQYFWGGLAGTTFWVDPAEELFAILMIQAPGQRDYYRTLFRDMVYAAIDD
ncbi:MAG TPA: serine hydrolase domain-containing protein [Steroidobacteraceae bacterium]|jgi:CubicO group peptidase (beta-lactamase class C family)|nr:serine hydrolase domain-containing protein [Steroidobacteraceae bacterium]